MLSLYDNNPLYTLYETLNEYISGEKELNAPEEIIDTILKVNDYTIDDNSQRQLVSITPYFFIYFVKNVNKNKNYDYIEIYGSKFIIVNLDYYSNLRNHNPSNKNEMEMTIDEKSEYLLGNSIPFNSIKSIVELFISIESPHYKNLADTIQGTTYFLAPTLIAASIVNNICGLTENDVEGNTISFDDIINILNDNKMFMILIGVRVK